MMTGDEEVASLRRRNEDLRATVAAQAREIGELKPIALEATDIMNMLGLCGEREIIDLPGFATAEKLRALIDGLIEQRRRADTLERVMADTHLVRCAFCGEPYPAGAGGLVANTPGLAEHVTTCPKHPYARVRKALAFAASVIKSGEPWSETCEKEIGGALAP